MTDPELWLFDSTSSALRGMRLWHLEDPDNRWVYYSTRRARRLDGKVATDIHFAVMKDISIARYQGYRFSVVRVCDPPIPAWLEAGLRPLTERFLRV